MYLEIQGVLHKVSLLLLASADLDPPIVTADPRNIKSRPPSEGLNISHVRHVMSFLADLELNGGTNVANFSNAVMAVVIRDTMRMRDTTGCFPEDWGVTKCCDDPSFDLLREDLAACNV